MDPTVVVHNLRTDSIGRLNETKFKYSFRTKTFFKASSIKHRYDKYQNKYAARLHVGGINLVNVL